jgi:hypothetical protein
MAITRSQTRKQVTKAPSTKRKKAKVPAKYLAGLSPAEKAKRKKEIERNRKKKDDDPSAYKFKTDFTASGKRRKTKESKYTKKFKKTYGRA